MTNLTLEQVEAAAGWASPEQCQSFCDAVTDELSVFLSDIQPSYEAARATPDQLLDVARSGKAFWKAFNALSPDARDRLEAGFVSIHSKAGDRSPADTAALLMRGVTQAADAAFGVASNADRLLKKIRRPSRAKAEDKFIVSVAVAFGNAFGRRATSAKSGRFIALLPVVLAQARLKPTISEARLQRILKDARLPGLAAKAGRPSKVN